ncbi:MAG: hypothetical protein ACYS1A_18960 [Planctomycetota bacterium]|jgi:hypothetical protein
MKGLTYALKIIAIVLNSIFLAGILFGMSRFDVHPQGLHDWAGLIFILVFPAITLITIALTFHKKGKILTYVLRIIAIIVNVFILIIIISAIAVERVYLEDFAQWLVCLMDLGLPVLNLVALALTLRKEKETNSDFS